MIDTSNNQQDFDNDKKSLPLFLVPSSSTKSESPKPPFPELSYPQRIAYGIGHVFNDLCVSMWFTYFIVFYHYILQIGHSYAGLLILIGQVADALISPVIGYLCDNTKNCYGGCKTWHLIGTGMVACSFFFFWHSCIYCTNQPIGYQILYFSCFIVVFQAGWAIVHVSHLALIPSLSADDNIKVELNSIRYAFTILSNSGLFITMLVLLTSVGGSSSKIGPKDKWFFSGTALGIIVIGLIFVSIFHLGIKEPQTSSSSTSSRSTDKIPWYKWFIQPRFYLVAVLYMCSRLVINLTLVYSPLYMYDSLGMYRSSVAIIPLVIYFSGLAATFVLKPLNKIAGRYVCFFVGLVLVWIAFVWFRLWPDTESHKLTHQKITENFIYGAGILVGIGSTTLFVTSLTMVSDLIGDKCGSSAFIMGVMNFTDKLSSGIAIQVIQIFNPCQKNGEKACCSACALYYRHVLSYVTGGASIVALIALVIIIIIVLIKRRQRETEDKSELEEKMVKLMNGVIMAKKEIEMKLINETSFSEQRRKNTPKRKIENESKTIQTESGSKTIQ